MKCICILVCMALLGCVVSEAVENTLSNPGFETGDLSEAANNAMGTLPWLTSDKGGNAIAATEKNARNGTYSLEWNPIGWNVNDEGVVEDASTFIMTNVGAQVARGGTEIRFAGAVNTSELGSQFNVLVVLANSSFTRARFDTILPGGASSWQEFETSLPLTSSDQVVFVALTVLGTSGVGAPGAAVYIDDLSLTYVLTEEEVEVEETVATETKPQETTPTEPTGDTRPFLMGFTPFGYDNTEAAARESLEFVMKHGDIVCHHLDGNVPWTEALNDEPFADALMASWKNLTDKTPEDVKVYVALTPLNMGRNGLADYRGTNENMPMPEPFKGKKFNDPVVKKAYLNYCRRAVAHFQPDYLAIGIEVNELAQNSPDKFPAFLELYKHCYDELKRDHPSLPIFASVTLHNLLPKEGEDRTVQHQHVKKLLPLCDLAGISYYSFFNTLDSAERPVESFAWIREFVGDMPIAIAETTFPAEPTQFSWAGSEPLTLPGSLEAQKSYYETLLDTAEKEDYLFVILFLHRDYDLLWERIKDSAPDWHKVWKDTGMLDGDGNPRPAWNLWEQWLARPHVR